MCRYVRNMPNVMNVNDDGPHNYNGPGACKRIPGGIKKCYRVNELFEKNNIEMRMCKQDKNKCGELNLAFQNGGRKTRYRHNRSHNRGRSRSRSHKRRRVSRRS